MAHEGHYFKCAGCDYIGEESELSQTPEHECGEDRCPECKSTDCILCCFSSVKNAEIEHWEDDENCECIECNPEGDD